MKKIIIFILLTVFFSCKKNNGSPDSVPKSYIINLKILDPKGDDLLNALNKEVDLKKSIQIITNEDKITYSVKIVDIYNEQYLRIDVSSLEDKILDRITYKIGLSNNITTEVYSTWKDVKNIMHVNSVSVLNKEITSSVINTPNPFYFYKVTID